MQLNVCQFGVLFYDLLMVYFKSWLKFGIFQKGFQLY